MIQAQFYNYETSEVADVEFDGYGYYDHRGDLEGFKGNITVEYDNGTKQVHTGEFGAFDFDEFEIINK